MAAAESGAQQARSRHGNQRSPHTSYRKTALTAGQARHPVGMPSVPRDDGRRILRMHEPFSLLLSVYDGDRPDYIRRAFRSAVDDQTVPPDQVVIVQDGPVRDELAQCLDELQARSPVPVTLVALRHNSGLGPA